jgi:hypothetical protein
LRDIAQPQFLRFNRRFTAEAAQKGTAFVKTKRRDLDLVFSIQQERVVNQDNTIQVDNRVFQIEKTRWRDTLAGATVVVREHLDRRVSIYYGPHRIAEYPADQLPLPAPRRRGTPRPPVGKAA